MLRILTRIVVLLLAVGLYGYIVYDTGWDLSRHQNPFKLVSYILLTFLVFVLLRNALEPEYERALPLADLNLPYALVATSAIVTYSWLELKAPPAFLSQHQLAITVVALLLVAVLLVLSYLCGKVCLPYIGLSLVAVVLFTRGWHFAAWLWLGLSLFYSYSYEYARYLLRRRTTREHNAAYPHTRIPIGAFSEAFAILLYLCFTGLTLGYLQTTRLPFPAWAYWCVLALLVLALRAAWLRLLRPRPLHPRFFVLARTVKACLPRCLLP